MLRSLRNDIRRALASGFASSSHRQTYTEIAGKYRVRPKHVYRLAHGKKMRNLKDYRIVEELLALHIMYRR